MGNSRSTRVITETSASKEVSTPEPPNPPVAESNLVIKSIHDESSKGRTRYRPIKRILLS